MPDDKRTRLIDTAVRCFAQRGFHGVTTAAVAAEAGVATGTLFRYFPTKEDLIQSAYYTAESDLCAWTGLGLRYPQDTAYDVFCRVWLDTAAKALAHPRSYRFWCLCWDTPGLPMRRADEHGPRRQLRALLGVERVLAMLLPGPAEDIQRLAFALEGQWRAAIECVLAHPDWKAPDPRAVRVLTRAFEAWWDGGGLDRTVPFPAPMPEAA